jgi:hypothetical protein
MPQVIRPSRLIMLGLTLLLAAAPGLRSEPRVIELAIQAGALPAPQRVVRLQQGEEVTLRWTTDLPVTLHLHGYDIETAVKPGAAATMTFRARATGRFPITLHRAHGAAEAVVGYVEVLPR